MSDGATTRHSMPSLDSWRAVRTLCLVRPERGDANRRQAARTGLSGGGRPPARELHVWSTSAREAAGRTSQSYMSRDEDAAARLAPSDDSTTSASVLRIMPATLAAFSSAQRVTFAGS